LVLWRCFCLTGHALPVVIGVALPRCPVHGGRGCQYYPLDS
jgi:hypothetical protein